MLLTKIRNFTILLVVGVVIFAALVIIRIGGGLNDFSPHPRIDAFPQRERDSVPYTFNATFSKRAKDVQVTTTVNGRNQHDSPKESPFNVVVWVRPGAELMMRVYHSDNASSVTCMIFRDYVNQMVNGPSSRTTPGSVRCQTITW